VPGFAKAHEADENTRAISEYNERLAAHPQLLTAVVPLRDGVAVSVKRS
jgi:predicted O-methyltransferase YrrM